MTYFNVLSIVREGAITDPAKAMGMVEPIFDVTRIGLERHQGKDAHFIVSADYEKIVNGESLFRVKVTTTWLIVGLDKNEEDKEFSFLKMLIVRSVSHLYGELACTFQDNNWPMMLPHHDPDFTKSFEMTKLALRDFFKA